MSDHFRNLFLMTLRRHRDQAFVPTATDLESLVALVKIIVPILTRPELPRRKQDWSPRES